MSGDDPNNPLNYSGLHITNEIAHTTLTIVNQYDTPHEKTIKIMDFIDKTIEVNKTYTYSQPETILHEKKGLCGRFSILAVAMLTTQHVPSRVIAMCGEKGHVAFEVYYDEDWHYYDPTFSAYWINNGDVLSFEELQTGGARNVTLVIGNMTRYNISNPIYLSTEIYETYYPAGPVTKECPLTTNCTPCKNDS